MTEGRGTVRSSMPLIALGLLVILLSSCSSGRIAPANANKAPFDPVTGLADYVNTSIGTGSGGKIVGDVSTFPGADVPFGMVQWSPDTVNPNPLQPVAGGYLYQAHTITGLSLNHLSGAGCAQYGNFSFMPYPGTPHVSPASDPSKYYASFSHSNEKASPGYYRVYLKDHISVRVSATTRTGVGMFGFPAGKPATLLIDTSASQTAVAGSAVQVRGNDLITGWVTTGHFCSSDSTYTAYFAAQFKQDFTSFGTWNGPAVNQGSRNAQGTSTGVYLNFGHPTADSPVTVNVDVGLSYTSVAGALANLKAAADGWNIKRVATAATRKWNKMLSRIQVSGGTSKEKTVFYTALYHSLLFPSVFSDANGEYLGFDGKLHTARSAPQYTNYSGWDIYRSEIPLLTLIAPHQLDGMVTSLLRDASQGGWLPRWPVANQYTGIMGGDSADLIIADAYAMGARSFNAAQALQDMVKGATLPGTGPDGYVERPGLAEYLKLGWVPESASLAKQTSSTTQDSASLTLEYATDDFGIYTLAKSLGQNAIARQFLARSGNWRNLLDPVDSMIVPRAANGAFPSGWPAGSFTLAKALESVHIQGVGQMGFQEGDSAQYTWAVPQDIAGLVQSIGGRQVALHRLSQFFTHLNAGPISQYDWAGNEPTLEVPWIGDYVGAPWLTQKVTHEIVNRFYTDSPGGEPGNDDLGAMSSWAVWAMMGMYPETPGTSTLVLGSPFFAKIRLTLPDGRSINIHAPDAGIGRPYVKSLSVNGHSYNKTYLSSNTVRDGASLSFTLSSNPDRSWATTPSSAPPSY